MQVAEIIVGILGTDVPVRVIGYDGSKVGPDTAETAVRVVSPRALARLATAPGSLGLARAYVAGELELEGDLYALLEGVADVALNGIPRAEQLRLARRLLPYALRHRVSPPALEYRPPGRLHSKKRDSKVIAHHYDVSNTFYEWVLGPSMAYTCAVYPTEDATLEQAVLQVRPDRAGSTCLDAAAGRRLRLGRDGPARCRAVRREGAGDAVARAGDGAQEKITTRPRRPRRGAAQRLSRDTETAFDAVSSIIDQHIGVRN
jgi:cyclopropane-fatty-acyl-phospholipid synthase